MACNAVASSRFSKNPRSHSKSSFVSSSEEEDDSDASSSSFVLVSFSLKLESAPSGKIEIESKRAMVSSASRFASSSSFCEL